MTKNKDRDVVVAAVAAADDDDGDDNNNDDNESVSSMPKNDDGGSAAKRGGIVTALGSLAVVAEPQLDQKKRKFDGEDGHNYGGSGSVTLQDTSKVSKTAGFNSGGGDDV